MNPNLAMTCFVIISVCTMSASAALWGGARVGPVDKQPGLGTEAVIYALMGVNGVTERCLERNQGEH
jgi:hypothetical protein